MHRVRMFPKLGRMKLLASLTGLAAIGLATLAAAASAACPDNPGSQLFKRWGDNADYSLAPGGSFEGALLWTTVGAPVLVLENNPFNLSGTGATSVRVRGTQSITSPPLCVSAEQPYMRFVARARQPGSRLVLEVLWDDNGTHKQKVLEEHPADLWDRWSPSKLVPLGAALPTGSNEIHEVRLRFSLKDGVGSWLVDDVFVDPLKRG